MQEQFAFVAYPSEPTEIEDAIEPALRNIRARSPSQVFLSWKQNDVAGRFISQPIIETINSSKILVADISALNFNVTYEIGYAIGAGKRVFLIKNRSLKGADGELRHIGIFDTLGYQEYENIPQLTTHFLNLKDCAPLERGTPDTKAPIFVLQFPFNTDVQNKIIARVKRSRLRFKNFDPIEQSRLSASEAIQGVSKAFGTIVPLAKSTMVDSRVHNIRAAFIAGLAHGLNRVTLILQEGDDPIPLDYRDFTESFKHPDRIDELIGQFALDVTDALQAGVAAPSVPRGALARLDLGSPTAENEFGSLSSYYLQTDEFQRTMRGEARIVVGRKGAGKTAVFAQVRDRIRSNKKMIVLDLRPEGYQLKKFKDEILIHLDEGTQEHTITAFWEYVLLLEVAYKIIEKDKGLYLRDHDLTEPYRVLESTYHTEEYSQEGDFSERMLRLVEHIAAAFKARHAPGEDARLMRSQVTEFLYAHDIRKLRSHVQSYMKRKDGLRILFDNLDKGWATNGVTPQDVLIVRCLLEASRKLEQSLTAMEISCHTTVFIRNDVYQLLVSGTPDRGKEPVVSLDWSEPDLLRELLLRRLRYNKLGEDKPFEDTWRMICVSHVNGEESSQYLIDRSLMRPRFLLDLISHCKANAINFGHNRIEQSDIEKGLATYSTDLIYGIDYEIRDIIPAAEDVLYLFFGKPAQIHSQEVLEMLTSKYGSDWTQRILEILIWYGVLGLMRPDHEPSYIHTVNYDMKRIKVALEISDPNNRMFQINPAFWAGLEILPQSLLV